METPARRKRTTGGWVVHSEDSNTLNTGFVERHNPAIRQGRCGSGCRTPCHAGHSEPLQDPIALTMMYY